MKHDPFTSRFDDWADLPFFLATARTGSLRGAAETLGATHATVDRRLRALETTYGVRLFDRSPAGLKLTDAGAALVPLAEEAETSVIAARRRVQGLDAQAAGLVRVSVPPTLAYSILPPIFSRFTAAHPEIELQIVVTYRLEDLSRAEADVSIRQAHEVSDDVVGRKVLQYAGTVFASEDYIARHLPTAGPSGEGLHWISWGPKDRQERWRATSPFPKAGLRHIARDGLMVTEMVRHGMGMSFLPWYAQSLAPDLVQVPGTEVTLDRSIWLLLHADLRRTTRVRLFVDHVARELKAMRDVFLGPLA